jgi:hypothetical protein
VFILWLLMRWDWLIRAGIYTLYGGIASLLAGALALARFAWVASRPDGLPRRRRWLSTVAGASVLLVNLPVAAGITAEE